jgi:hypothetical protein
MNSTAAHISLPGRKAVSTMSYPNLLIWVAWIAHAASWFLTAVEIQEIGAPVGLPLDLRTRSAHASRDAINWRASFGTTRQTIAHHIV